MTWGLKGIFVRGYRRIIPWGWKNVIAWGHRSIISWDRLIATTYSTWITPGARELPITFAAT